MEYTELKCSLPEGDSVYAELILARLGELGFESFEETGEGLLAYIPSSEFDPAILNNPDLWPEGIDVEYTWAVIPEQNWNAVWEENFEPVTLAGRCHIRAPFHPVIPGIEYEIIIEPKMSFGTAHHETTALMIEYLLEEPVEGLTVLDMGSGTGVLAILAAMRGATDITAIDNDEWAYRNAIENVERNKSRGISVYLGDAGLLNNDKKFDFIIANINRNILLKDIEVYCKSLEKGGTLLMSGFYFEDIAAISDAAALSGLTYQGHKERNKWVAVCYK
ncbi:MAG: 50S ribosomal protein L11 methyltransferase [Bacteroidales bacterium]|nr:50S ribosomal protein L11 methyltransferase [Bacteroidales bacterium]